MRPIAFRVLAAIVCGLLSAAWGDSIAIDGKWYTGISLRESSSRYYFTLPDGQAVSVSKDRLGPDDVVRGDAPPKIASPGAPKSGAPPEAPVTPETPSPPPAPAPAFAPPDTQTTTAPPTVPAPAAAPAAVPISPQPAVPEPAPMPVASPTPEPPQAPAPVSVPAPAPEAAPPVEASVPAPVPEPPVTLEPVVAPVQESTPEPVSSAPAELEPESVVRAEIQPLVLPQPDTFFAGAARSFLSGDLGDSEVNALILKSGNTTLCLISVDCGAVTKSWCEETKARLAEANIAVSPDAVLIAATGGAGVCMGEAPAALGVSARDQAARNGVIEAVVQAVLKAEQSLRRAAILFGETDASEVLTGRLGDDALVDGTLSGIAVQTSEKEALAFVVNLALFAPLAEESADGASDGVLRPLRNTLRERAGAQVPVLFFNGAAGDTSMAEGVTCPPVADKLAPCLDRNQPETRIALAYATRTISAPPSLAGDCVPEKTVMQEFRIGENVLLTIPAVPAAEIGLLLRVKAMSQRLDHVFVIANANDYLGYLPSVSDYFAASEESQASLFGPLTALWCAENCLPASGESDVIWKEVPDLAPYAKVFSEARERGALEAAQIRTLWSDASSVVPQLAGLVEESRGAAAAESRGEKRKPGIGTKEILSALRMEFADFSAEERVRLMGIAEGAGLPFDAVMFLQLLADKDRQPQRFSEAVQGLKLPGKQAPDLKLL